MNFVHRPSKDRILSSDRVSIPVWVPRKLWNIQRQARGYRASFGCGNVRDVDNELVMAEFHELALRPVASRFNHQITYGRGRHNNSTKLLNGKLDTEVTDNPKNLGNIDVCPIPRREVRRPRKRAARSEPKKDETNDSLVRKTGIIMTVLTVHRMWAVHSLAPIHQ
jgi:hypothetical protein